MNTSAPSCRARDNCRRLPPHFGGTLYLAGLLLSVACNQRELSPVERGERGFMRHCATCHGANGAGLPTPGVQTPPANLASDEFQRSRSDADIKAVLKNGKGAMPALGRFMTEEDIDELILFIRHLPERRR
jgi:mono/diheme cytochrome c family protein